jgi:cell division septation protein DedD
MAGEDGSFTLDEQAAEPVEDAAEDKPLIPEPEESNFFVEEQEVPEEKKTSVVGTSQARLEAAAEAAVDDERNALDPEREPVSEPETSIPPYFIERERSIRNLWPWIGGGAALIIILAVAAWFFFPGGFTRIFGEKSAEVATTEEIISGESTPPTQDIPGESGPEAGGIETEAAVPETAQSDAGQTMADQTGETPAESVDESVSQTEVPEESEPVTPPAAQTRKYYIVAGMFSSRNNAENLVHTLKDKGYNAELFGRKDNLYAVSFSSHVSKTAALEDLARIRQEANAKAWLLYY